MKTNALHFVRLLISAAAIAFTLYPAKAIAMMMGWPCDEPQIFPGAAVNVVVLPYDTSLEKGMGLSALGNQLSLLIQEHLLYDALQHKSIGVIQLVPPS